MLKPAEHLAPASSRHPGWRTRGLPLGVVEAGAGGFGNEALESLIAYGAYLVHLACGDDERIACCQLGLVAVDDRRGRASESDDDFLVVVRVDAAWMAGGFPHAGDDQLGCPGRRCCQWPVGASLAGDGLEAGGSDDAHASKNDTLDA